MFISEAGLLAATQDECEPTKAEQGGGGGLWDSLKTILEVVVFVVAGNCHVADSSGGAQSEELVTNLTATNLSQGFQNIVIAVISDNLPGQLIRAFRKNETHVGGKFSTKGSRAKRKLRDIHPRVSKW